MERNCLEFLGTWRDTEMILAEFDGSNMLVVQECLLEHAGHHILGAQ